MPRVGSLFMSDAPCYRSISLMAFRSSCSMAITPASSHDLCADGKIDAYFVYAVEAQARLNRSLVGCKRTASGPYASVSNSTTPSAAMGADAITSRSRNSSTTSPLGNGFPESSNICMRIDRVTSPA